MELSADEWADQQWGQVDLGDERLDRRAVTIGTRMATNPEDSLLDFRVRFERPKRQKI